MRIVHFLSRFKLADGGVVRAVLDLCSLLARPVPAGSGMDVRVLCCVDDDVPEAWRSGRAGEPRVIVIEAPQRGTRLSATALEHARQTIVGADVVHLHGMWMTCNVQVAEACRRARVACVWSPHGMLDDWSMAQKPLRKRAYMAVLGGRVLARAAAIHCTAKQELEQAGKWFPAGKGRVIRLPFDISAFCPGPGPGVSERSFAIDRSLGPVVLYLGRLHHKKGADVLIRACSELNARGRACQLLIAGTAGEGEEAYKSRLERLAAEPAIAGRVRFLGLVTGELKASLYQAATVFCLPSSQENFGYVIAEAMASGTPVVTTKQVALFEELAEFRAGVVCDDNALDRVVDAIDEVLRDPVEARRMGERGRARAAQAFDPRAVAGEFARMYAKATGGGVVR